MSFRFTVLLHLWLFGRRHDEQQRQLSLSWSLLSRATLMLCSIRDFKDGSSSLNAPGSRRPWWTSASSYSFWWLWGFGSATTQVSGTQEARAIGVPAQRNRISAARNVLETRQTDRRTNRKTFTDCELIGTSNTCPVHNHCVVQNLSSVFRDLALRVPCTDAYRTCLGFDHFGSSQEPSVSYALSHLDSFRDAPWTCNWTRFYGTPQSHHPGPGKLWWKHLETMMYLLVFTRIYSNHQQSMYFLVPWCSMIHFGSLLRCTFHLVDHASYGWAVLWWAVTSSPKLIITQRDSKHKDYL